MGCSVAKYVIFTLLVFVPVFMTSFINFVLVSIEAHPVEYPAGIFKFILIRYLAHNSQRVNLFYFIRGFFCGGGWY